MAGGSASAEEVGLDAVICKLNRNWMDKGRKGRVCRPGGKEG